MNPTKKEIKEIESYLGLYFLDTTGYRKINGGYADFTIKESQKIEIDKDQLWFKVSGYLVSGKDGEEHSEEYTDKMELYLIKDEDKIQLINKAIQEEAVEQFELFEDDDN